MFDPKPQLSELMLELLEDQDVFHTANDIPIDLDDEDD